MLQKITRGATTQLTKTLQHVDVAVAAAVDVSTLRNEKLHKNQIYIRAQRQHTCACVRAYAQWEEK